MGTPNCWKLLMGGIRNSKEQNPETNHTNQALKATNKIIVSRGVARGGPGVPVTLLPPPPPLVGLLLSKQPTIFRWRKRHDNILAVKAIVEKPTFLKFGFL